MVCAGRSNVGLKITLTERPAPVVFALKVNVIVLSPLPKTCDAEHQVPEAVGIVSHQPSEPALMSTSTFDPADGIIAGFSTVTPKVEG